jgi:hypothetical protein
MGFRQGTFEEGSFHTTVMRIAREPHGHDGGIKITLAYSLLPI